MSSHDEPRLHDHVVKEFATANEARFAVAYPKAAGYTDENLDTELSRVEGEEVRVASDGSWVDVYWPVHTALVWGQLDDKVRDLGIANVSVFSYAGPVWKWEIMFKNEKGWGFQFKDATGDVYRISTPLNGWHYLLYNSSDPTIVGVK